MAKRVKTTAEDFEQAYAVWSEAGLKLWSLAQDRVKRKKVDQAEAEAIILELEDTHRRLVRVVDGL